MNNKTKVLCHQVFRNAKRISIQCTKPFMRIVEAAEGFGGVDILDEGAGWYTMIPRSELNNGDIATDVDKMLFLAYASVDLERIILALEALDTHVVCTVVPAIDGANKHKPKPQPKYGVQAADLGQRPTVPGRTAFRVIINSPLSSAMRMAQPADRPALVRLASRFGKRVGC